jgi:hypothetical protein
MSEQEITPTLDDEFVDCLIRVNDINTAIYRIFPLWFLEETLRLRQLVLTSPEIWEDPLEIVGDAINVIKLCEGLPKSVIINQSLPPAFAQCWSTTAESDTLLRAYSKVLKDPHFRRNICPRDEGVKVRSTPRKLLKALLAGTPDKMKGHWFLGKVMYLSREALFQEIANAIKKCGLKVFEEPKNRARLLLLKREAFSHEDEVRVIFVQKNPEPRNKLINVKINPSEVFDEISFDPRLEKFEFKEREMVIKNLGYKGVITESELYKRIVLQVDLTDSRKVNDAEI